MISAIQVNSIYELTFRYDPQLIDLVKNVPGRRWDADRKIWTIPSDKLGFLINQLKGTAYEDDLFVQSTEQIDVNAKLPSSADIPDIDISNLPLYIEEGKTFFNHQLDAFKFSLARHQAGNHHGFILADSMGLGKTLQAMNLAIHAKQLRGCKHALIIVCVNSAKYNWIEDIEKHSNGQIHPYLLGSRKKRDGSIRYDGSSEDKLKDLQMNRMFGKDSEGELPYFLIVNIECFRQKKKRTYTFTEEIINWCSRGDIGFIAIDEIHKNASQSSVQGQQIHKLCQKIGDRLEWLPMTGTPITNRPTDVFLPLKLVGGHYYTSYYEWCKEFCVYGGFGNHDIISYKNIPLLKEWLSPNMLRRTKDELLDLPEKIYKTEYVDNTRYQEILYNKTRDEIRLHQSEIVHSLNPLANFLKLRQVNGCPELIDENLKVDSNYINYNAKISKCLELVDAILEQNEKVLIFSNWLEPLRAIYRILTADGHKVLSYVGSMKDEERERSKKLFRESNDHRILIGTISAMGTSHTFTSANNVIFLDEPWLPSDFQQACDRVHRPGQDKTCNIYTIITRDTIDDRVHKILYRKQGISDFMIDDKIDIRKDPELFNLLLG